MKTTTNIPPTLLAPCGMNCYACYVHLKEKKPCMGCRVLDSSQPEHCRKCEIKICAASRGIDFCFACQLFPCTVIKRLDKSYRQKYQVSLINNAVQIQTVGIRQYLLEEKKKWTCRHCGGVISLHDRICSKCGKEM